MELELKWWGATYSVYANTTKLPALLQLLIGVKEEINKLVVKCAYHVLEN